MLRYHPLAINQAILYINKNNISLQKYLDIFRSYPVKILEESLPTEPETKSAITSTYLVLNKINISNEKSVDILNHLSYGDGQNITTQFIHDILKYLKMGEEYLINRLIAALASYSLLDSFDVNNDRYAMHEITQLACKPYQMRKKITVICNKNILDFQSLQQEDVKEHAGDGRQFFNHFLHMFCINKQKLCEVFHQQCWTIHISYQIKVFFKKP